MKIEEVRAILRMKAERMVKVAEIIKHVLDVGANGYVCVLETSTTHPCAVDYTANRLTFTAHVPVGARVWALGVGDTEIALPYASPRVEGGVYVETIEV